MSKLYTYEVTIASKFPGLNEHKYLKAPNDFIALAQVKELMKEKESYGFRLLSLKNQGTGKVLFDKSGSEEPSLENVLLKQMASEWAKQIDASVIMAARKEAGK